MRKKNGLEILTDEIVIPEIVEKRAQEAFDQIRREAEREDPKIMMLSEEREERKENSVSQRRRGRKTRRSVSAAILTAVLIIGAMSTVAMAAFRGSLVDSLKEMFHISDEQEEALLNREDGLVHIIESEQSLTDREATKETAGEAISGMTEAEEATEEDVFSKAGDVTSVTVNGVTVKLTQAMVDQFYICVAVRAEGIPNEEDKSLTFEEMHVRVIGEDGQEYRGSGGGSVGSNEPGTIDLDWSMQPRRRGGLEENVPGWFFGKKLQITLINVKGYRNAKEPEAEEILVEGKWVLTWTIEGTEESRTFELNQALGNTGAAVQSITLSPLSSEIRYIHPKQLEEVPAEGGKTATVIKDPPYLMGVLLKDGTVITGLLGMGKEGYASEAKDLYICTYKMKHILDPDEIDSFLFKKKNFGPGEHEYVLEDFYVVPVTE